MFPFLKNEDTPHSIRETVFQRAKRRDKAARYFIIGAGVSVIFSVIGILFLIAFVAFPLFLPPEKQIIAQFQAEPEQEFLAVAMDEYLESGALLDSRGVWSFYDLRKGTVLLQKPSTPPGESARKVQSVQPYGQNFFSLFWNDGSVSVVEVQFKPEFTQSGRRILHDVLELAAFPPHPEGMPLQALARAGIPGEEEQRQTLVRLFPENRLEILQKVTTADLFGNQQQESFRASVQGRPVGRFTRLAMDSAGKNLYAGTDQGALWHGSLEEPGEPQLLQNFVAFEDGRAITALNLIFGDISLAVGDSKGNLTTWFLVPIGEDGTQKTLQLVHQLPPHTSAILQIIPSKTDKSILSLDEAGTVHWDHATSERRLLQFSTNPKIDTFTVATRGNGLVALGAENEVTLWEVDNPHPEISWQTLFGKVLYEDYPKPDFVWQSSSASDDFEPKFSLVPLIFGSFKGTVYAMLLAIPLALLGAIYTSQFANESFRQTIKPGIEIMAAMPSVIIGFMVALWLAPVVEGYILSFFLALVLIPLAIFIFVGGWFLIRHQEWAKRIEAKGYEFILMLPVVVLACWLTVPLQGLVEQAFFGGDFKHWLFTDLGIRYEQRNSVIIAFGLGFMVIPIIFTMSDDALSNVPASLKHASLALGASRWQTVWRIVIPSASPGIFAACIIGFGRAVGETMVVLMATGNTPILDGSIFNGMRTLSANIAVELPEAPVDSTLYRILFLSAVVLFVLTSVLNTVAEIIRQRLRKKYGQFQ